MNETTIHMITRAKHHETQQAAEFHEAEGYTIYVQGWLPRQWSRLQNLISLTRQQADESARQQDVAHNAG
jgi:hypothetical protein